MSERDFTEIEMQLMGAISYLLWRGLEYSSPAAPGYIARKLVEELAELGWQFSKAGGNDNTNTAS